MAQQELSAGPVSLLQLLKGEYEYVSPLFQRQYVWSDKELHQLWDDIDEILDQRATSRFLGALVLEVKEAGLSFRPDSCWIVDGQQRMTTLYSILLQAAIYAAKEGSSALADTLCNKYLLNQDGDYKLRPKLRPTLLDDRQFNAMFEELTTVPTRLPPAYGSPDGKLEKACKFIKKEVRARCRWAGKYSEERAMALVSVVLERLKFVQIVLGDGLDPHQVFDSLNAKGVRLENKDLIRNIVFQRLADDPLAAQALYTARWIPLEENLNSAFDGYFFPFVLVHKPSATKSTLLSTLRARWASFTPDQILDDLKVYVKTYKALSHEIDYHSETSSKEVNLQLARLCRMPVPTSVYTFVFSVVHAWEEGRLSETDLVTNLQLVESLLVRRAVAGFEPTGLHAVFRDMWGKTQGDPAQLISDIDDNVTVEFPDDAKFQSDIALRALYGRRLAPYIIDEYERALVGGDPYMPMQLTIDHVMPQQLTDAWREVVNTEDHRQLKDTWGNLVPLSGAANSEKGQRGWEQVKSYLLTETRFKTTKRLAVDHDRWDAGTIEARNEHLGAWAVARWPKSAG